MELLLPILGGALGAALVNTAFSFFKLRQDRQLEHHQWRRGQQQIEYSKFLEAHEAHHSAILRMRAGLLTGEDAASRLDVTHEAFLSAARRLLLVAPAVLVTSSGRVQDATEKLLEVFHRQFHLPKDESTDEAWHQALAPVGHAVSDFTIMARHEIGLLEDDAGHIKTRSEIEAALIKRRRAQGSD